MINLNAYSGRELQNFLAMLNQFESAGRTDIRFVREHMHNHIHKGRLTKRRGGIAMKKCPECLSRMVPVATYDSNNILGCKVCRYSEMMNG